MTQPDCTILYVRDPAISAGFYQRVLGQAPVEASANFVMFALARGTTLGLWRREDVEPQPTAPGGCELGFPVAAPAEVDRLHEEWRQAGTEFVQAPVEMDFGRTCTALDPDGHRLRVFHPRG